MEKVVEWGQEKESWLTLSASPVLSSSPKGKCSTVPARTERARTLTQYRYPQKQNKLNIKGNITMGKEAKTNAMRILEREKVPYTAHEYAHEEGVAVDGVTVAASMGEDPACVYKTLVTQGASKNYFVFVIPVAAELDLKAAARSVGEKSVAMIHVADINKVTGYVRGGCSPVGMKKQYKTVFDESVLTQQKVYVSGGRIGTQVCCAPADLIRAARAATAKIIF